MTMKTISEYLAERAGIHDATTFGEWIRKPTDDGSLFGNHSVDFGQVWGSNWKRDATAIVDAHHSVSRLVSALRAVTSIHVPETEYGPDHYSGKYSCEECNRSDQEGLSPTLWPCPTVRAIADALGVEP